MSMELSELYESDLSLFARDILLGLNSPGDVKSDGIAQDGFFTTTIAQEKPVTSNHVALIPSSIGQTEQGLDDQFDASWLDATVDLLGFLGDEMVDPTTIQSQSEDDNVVSLAPINNAQTDNPGFVALDVLQSLAEETDRQIKETKKEAAIRGALAPSHLNPNQGSGEKGLLELLTLGLMDTNNNGSLLDVSVDDVEIPDMMTSFSPVLSPVSIDDIESLLSSSSRPTSPGDCSFYAESITSDVGDSDSDYYPSDDVSPRSSSSKQGRKSYIPRSAPYTKSKPPAKDKILDRKARKKQQNREAALRYREKKRSEGNGIDYECEKLEKRNKDLTNKVDEMTREIQYLKDLMSDVYKAKGQGQP